MVNIALSPCPNDTFLFHAWIEGIVGQDLRAKPTFADIEELNGFALKGQFPLLKLSFSTLRHVLNNYELLPVGAALGYNVGPKIIAKKKVTLADLPKLKMAVPGQNTTAHLLANHLAPQPKEKHFCLYHEMSHLLHSGLVDCALIIHESRFTFQREGFYEVADLGTLWHEKYNLPLPLGCLAIKREFAQKQRVIEILTESLQFAWENPRASKEFVLKYAQEKEEKVVQDHIDLYVTQESLNLSPQGKKSIELLLSL